MASLSCLLLSLSFLPLVPLSCFAPYRCCRREAADSLLAASRAPRRAASAGGSSMRAREQLFFCLLSRREFLREAREDKN